MIQIVETIGAHTDEIKNYEASTSIKIYHRPKRYSEAL